MSEESTFVDLGMDSLDMVELSMDLEDNLDIDLRGVELSWSTVAEAIDCVVGLKTKAQNV
jgi:acyl carrier protein